MEQLKTAMARIVINIIQADGIIDDREVKCLEQIKRDFKITDEDMLETRYVSFCEALNILKANYVDEQSDIDNFITAINDLARTDNVVSANEAMLLLSIKYVIEEGFVAFSNHCSINFSKREVLFLDNTENSEYEQLMEESLYDTVKNSFIGYGFRFIFIPRVIKALTKKGEILEQIIRYLYPDVKSERLATITESLKTMTTAKYSEIIADVLNCSVSDLEQSLLFKITTSDIYDREEKRFVSYDDFIVFRLEIHCLNC